MNEPNRKFGGRIEADAGKNCRLAITMLINKQDKAVNQHRFRYMYSSIRKGACDGPFRMVAGLLIVDFSPG